jgi:hypothetical protein
MPRLYGERRKSVRYNNVDGGVDLVFADCSAPVPLGRVSTGVVVGH